MLLMVGCVQVEWGRTTVEEPFDKALVTGLETGADLGVCLDRLGAPLRAWETEEGIALAYGYINTRELGFSVSVEVYKGAAASFSYDDERLKWEGAVLWFDDDLKLIRARTGLLSEIVPRRRPSVEES